MSAFLTARHYSNSPTLVISFDYSWFVAKNRSNFVSLPWKLHNRYCHNVQSLVFNWSLDFNDVQFLVLYISDHNWNCFVIFYLTLALCCLNYWWLYQTLLMDDPFFCSMSILIFVSSCEECRNFSINFYFFFSFSRPSPKKFSHWPEETQLCRTSRSTFR